LIEEGRELVRAGPVDVLVPVVRHNALMGASQKGKEIERPSYLGSLIEPDATKSINKGQNISSGSPISETPPQLEQHEELSYGVEAAELSEEIDNIARNDYYLNMPASFWKELAVDGIGNPRRSLPETEALWTELFGGVLSTLPDNRVDLTF
jgi:hypothetical protein